MDEGFLKSHYSSEGERDKMRRFEASVYTLGYRTKRQLALMSLLMCVGLTKAFAMTHVIQST